jgi:hypothetical protein
MGTLDVQPDQYIVGVESASHVASMKLLQLEKSNEFAITSSIEITNDAGTLSYYVFLLQPIGYIVVSPDVRLPPVIAYSFTTDFHSDDSEGNVLLELLRADIHLRLSNIDHVSDHIIEQRNTLWNSLLNEELEIQVDRNFKQWPPEQTTPTGGWLETSWHQEAPFNNFCPIDPESGDRSIAGCPAVAIAQILNYHQSTHNTVFDDNDDYYHNYVNQFWIDDDHETYDFPSWPELNGYLDVLEDHYRNNIPLTDDDKASLNFACGVAAKQVYTPEISGTFGVNQAYDAYLRFNYTTIELLDEDDIDLYDRLIGNMVDALPAHLAVVNEDWTVGHNLVVDGYNTDGYYHLNFGWGGRYDGWYLLPEDLPFELTVIEGVIVDIIDGSGDSNLHTNGVLYWADVQPGSTVMGNFTIENVGDPGLEIDWEVITWPDWGTWMFTPSSGDDLTPEDGPIPIDVSVEVPDRRKQSYSGHIKIVNKNNYDDSCLIHVSLATSNYKDDELLFLKIFQCHSHTFPLLRHLFEF